MSDKAILIRLKIKPTPPKRGNEVISCALYDGISLKEILRDFEGVDLEKVTFDYDYDDWDGFSGQFYTRIPERDESFNRRQAEYEEAITKYNAWYEENREIIEKEKARRAELAEKQRLKELEKEEAKLRKSLAKIEQLKGRIEP